MPVLRRLSREDAALWKGFRIEMLTVAPTSFGASLRDTENRDLAAFADWLESGHIFGAFVGDLVGSAAWYAEDDPKTNHRAKLVSVYVRASHRGQGLLDQLLAAVIEDARAAGKMQIELDVTATNSAAVKAYERNGFAIAGRIPNALNHDGIFTDDFIMLRSLVEPHVQPVVPSFERLTTSKT